MFYYTCFFYTYLWQASKAEYINSEIYQLKLRQLTFNTKEEHKMFHLLVKCLFVEAHVFLLQGKCGFKKREWFLLRFKINSFHG